MSPRSWGLLGPCWGHVGPVLGLCWAMLGVLEGKARRIGVSELNISNYEIM